MIKTSATLNEAASELIEYSREHGFDPFKLLPPGPEFARLFEHEGLRYKVCFTRMAGVAAESIPGRTPYLLSVCKLSAVPNERGALLPTEEEAVEIARIFFPRGCSALPDELDDLGYSRKYISLL